LPISIEFEFNRQLAIGNWQLGIGVSMKSANRAVRPRGFTLIELLVVIGIILLLLAILLPVASQVRIRAYNTSTQSQMSRIMAACQNYYHDFNAYPGPIANAYLSQQTPVADPSPSKLTPPGGTAITSSENLVLGLLGFLSPPSTANPKVTLTQAGFPTSMAAIATNPVQAPIHDVLSLNPLHPAAYHYIDYVAEELSPGPASLLEYAAGQAMTDTCVPEFVDRFPEHLPILYMRANAGSPGTPSGTSTIWVGATDTGYQYNLTEVVDYFSNIRESNTHEWLALGTTTYFTAGGTGLWSLYSAGSLASDIAMPYNDWAQVAPATSATYYLANPNVAGSVLGKDGFVLISAGIDHVYGTRDDIIVTP
jgi:prepilin-type N-terminal cleavage/methylation domain-containing protein